MASGRFLSISVAEDDRLSKLSMAAELFYLKTIPHLDRDGMITGKPGLLWSKVCPLREELFGETASLIEEWINVGLVIRFNTSEGAALFFTGFAKNNNLPHYERERPSRFSPPPGYYRTEKGLFPDGVVPPTKKPKGPTPEPVNDIDTEVQELVQELVPILGPEEEEEDKEEVVVRASEPAAAAKPLPKPRTVSDFVKAYERIWGLTVASSYIGDLIKEWESKVTYEGWCYALQESAKGRNAGNWKYFGRILERIEREGYQPKQEAPQPQLSALSFALEELV